MLLSKALGVLSLLSSQALGAAIASELKAPIPGYAVVELETGIEVFPGQIMNFTGTPDEVHRQASAINPRWEEEYSKREESSQSLERRSRPVWKNRVCGQAGHKDWFYTRQQDTRVQVVFVRRRKGWPILEGRSCVIVKGMPYEFSAYVWICNDNPGKIQLGGWADVADAIQLINDDCLFFERTLNLGQQFAQGNWNVVVRGVERYIGAPFGQR